MEKRGYDTILCSNARIQRPRMNTTLICPQYRGTLGDHLSKHLSSTPWDISLATFNEQTHCRL